MKRLVLLLAATLWAGCAYAQSLSFPGPGSPASSGGGGGGGMVFPLLSAGSSTAANNASVTYGPLFSSATSIVNFTTNAAGNLLFGTMIPIAGTISGLTVRFPTAVVTGTFNIALYKNSTAAAALTCTIGVGFDPNVCSDLSNSVTVAPGDHAGWKITPTGTPTAQTSFQIGAIFTATANEAIISAAGSGNYSTTVVQYVGFGGIMAFNATRTSVDAVVPTAGTIDRLWVHSLASPGTNGIWLTVYKNGSATTLQCRLTSLTPCSELTQSVSVVAGDLISLEACPNGSATAPVTPCVPGTAPTGTSANASVRWVPTTPGEYIVMANSPTGSPGNTVPNYYGLSGGGQNTITAENLTYFIAPTSFTIKNLFVSLLTAPGAGNSRIINLRSGSANVGTPGPMTCSLTTGTTCTDTTNTFGATSGNLLNWMTSNTGTPATTTGARASVVVTTP